MNMNSMYLVTNYSILVNDQQKVYILSTKVLMHDIEHFQNRYKTVQKPSELIWKEINKTLTFKMYNWINLVYTAIHATLCDHLGGYFLSLNCKSKYYTTGKGMWNSNILSVCTHLDTYLIFLFCKGSEKSITDDYAKHTFVGGISSKDPNSSNEILLYNLLADNKLCSITALSRILEPEKHWTEKLKHIKDSLESKYTCTKCTFITSKDLKQNFLVKGFKFMSE